MTASDVIVAMETLPDAELDTILGGERPLILAPHADDESLGCGGLIAACCVAAHAQIRIANAKPFSVRSVVVHLRAAGRKQVVLAFSRSQESKLKAARSCYTAGSRRGA